MITTGTVDDSSCAARARSTAQILKPGAVNVELAKADALGVGYTLLALSKQGTPNKETAALLGRVGQQMVDAAFGTAAASCGCAAASCGCAETYPQLQPGRLNHGPGCAVADGAPK